MIPDQLSERFFQQHGKGDPVNNQGNIVTHQHGGDEPGRLLGEKADQARKGFFLLPVDFGPELVGRDKGYFHARKKGRKQNGNQYKDDQV